MSSTSPRRLQLGLACVGLALVLGACNLYFGPDSNSDHWTYCDQTGCYDCYGNQCSPAGGNGYYCSSNADCAVGCYCDLNSDNATYGTCVESGFCSTSAECPDGYTCTNDTCVPPDQPTSCNSNSDCAAGSYCDATTGQCTPGQTCGADGTCPTGTTCDSSGTCVPVECTSNSDCATGSVCENGSCVVTGYCTDSSQCGDGYYCDTTRGTCAQASCAGDVTCNLGAPTCPPDQVPTIADGCWTGLCLAVASCDADPSCAVLNTESSCLARNDCAPSYTGHNCQHPDGSACSSGNDPTCVCESYSFASCGGATP
jgi:Cys-rich repeat protein